MTLQQLLAKLGILQAQLTHMDELRLKLYNTAKAHLGQNLAPGNEYLGCAQSVSKVISLAFGEKINIISTFELWKHFEENDEWERIDSKDAKEGDVIISPTGTEPDHSRVNHGHTGFFGKIASPDGSVYIMSNNSLEKMFDTQWTVRKWHDFFGIYGGFPEYVYRRIK